MQQMTLVFGFRKIQIISECHYFAMNICGGERNIALPIVIITSVYCSRAAESLELFEYPWSQDAG